MIWTRIFSIKKSTLTLTFLQVQLRFILAERVGFALRHYFSSLVFARLFLYFSHVYYFFVAITRKEILLHSKDENGIQPFPAGGSPTAGFSLSLKCERRQRVAAYFIPTSLGGKSGIRSATLFLFTCFRSAPLILLSFLLFLCRYHSQKKYLYDER